MFFFDFSHIFTIFILRSGRKSLNLHSDNTNMRHPPHAHGDASATQTSDQHMNETIRGIVIKTVKYGDSSLIVDLFTESRGRCSFMTTTARIKRSVRTSTLWHPLSMVEFTADIRDNASRLPRPQEVRSYYCYSTLMFSPAKSAIALFLAEFLSAALREEKTNAPLYKYIESSLQWLDTTADPRAIANFHIVFLMHLSRFIGIYPNLEGETDCFDLRSGCYTSMRPFHSDVLLGAEARALPTLFRLSYATMHVARLSRAERMRTLNVLNDYYRLHMPGFPELKSIEVLHEMFSDPSDMPHSNE